MKTNNVTRVEFIIVAIVYIVISTALLVGVGAALG